MTVVQFVTIMLSLLWMQIGHTVFLRSDAPIHFAARFVRLLFECGVYFIFGKPGDVNNGELRMSETVTVAGHCQ